MAQGLRMSWKQPIYFDFDTPMTVTILYKLIEKLYMVGYHVVGIVNDLGPGNHKLWTNLGVSPGLVVDGKIITQQTVRQAMKYASSSDLSILWKVTDEHLNVKSAGRQRVKLATQLFSNTTSSAIKRCYSLGLDMYNAPETADFIKLVNDWFDIFNEDDQEEDLEEQQDHEELEEEHEEQDEQNEDEQEQQQDRKPLLNATTAPSTSKKRCIHISDTHIEFISADPEEGNITDITEAKNLEEHEESKYKPPPAKKKRNQS
ncbi:hypothetical protein ACLKA7_005644 [Drosophila subpalustris]